MSVITPEEAHSVMVTRLNACLSLLGERSRPPRNVEQETRMTDIVALGVQGVFRPAEDLGAIFNNTENFILRGRTNLS